MCYLILHMVVGLLDRLWDRSIILSGEDTSTTGSRYFLFIGRLVSILVIFRDKNTYWMASWANAISHDCVTSNLIFISACKNPEIICTKCTCLYLKVLRCNCSLARNLLPSSLKLQATIMAHYCKQFRKVYKWITCNIGIPQKLIRLLLLN